MRAQVLAPGVCIGAVLIIFGSLALPGLAAEPTGKAASRQPDAQRGDAAGDAAQIKSAQKAAPAKVAVGASIMVMQADGTMRTLRTGTNGFTCMADNPATPGPDPMCMDANALAWVHAWVAHQSPPTGKVGLMYMLEGGTDASNTDPYATQPTASNNWVKTGPHVMIVGADPSFYGQYPKLANPDTASPYVMWAGTPYEHLMAPVR